MITGKPNALLQFVMKEAKRVDGKSNAPFTTERFLIALIEFAITPAGLRVPAGTSLEPCFTILKEKHLLDPAIRNLLLELLKDDSNPLQDELFMHHHMNAVQRKIGDAEMTPEDLLKRVLDIPNVNVSRCLEAARLTSAFGQSESQEESDDEPLVWFDEDDDDDLGIEKKEEPKTTAMGQVKALSQSAVRMRNTLMKSVLGQNHAVNAVASGLFRAQLRAMLGESKGKPMATFLFAGPPGVGKTYLAETTANLLCRPFMRFDMSEYCDKEAAIEFCGSDKVYKNGKAGNFTSFVEENPECVVLFDEVEKAHINIIHQFLQILDAGRIRDNYTDHEISLEKAVLIFTTNAGKQLYTDSSVGNLATLPRKVILKALEKDVNPVTDEPYFPAAICSRFATGNVVMFNHLSAGRLQEIARKRIEEQVLHIEKNLALSIKIDPRVYATLVYAEGGSADARTIRARADNFVLGELHELFRLMNSKALDVSKLRQVEMDVLYSADNKEVAELYENDDQQVILVFAGDKTAKICAKNAEACRMTFASDADEAARKLLDEDVSMVLLDIHCGIRQGMPYLNTEDMDSSANDFLDFLQLRHNQLPVYLLSSKEDEEEQIQSYLDRGVNGVVDVSGNMRRQLEDIVAIAHQQTSMWILSRAHKAVSYNTAQTVSEDGTEAKILLTDLNLKLAVEAEDNKSILSDISKPNVRFEQVIGADDAKQELRYFADYLKNPKKYRGTGVRPPKGILLYGPPGTGKTMLAKAMACEADVTFISVEGNQFLKRYHGQGQEKVHELFNTARKYAPAVLFVDEIDAIAKERGAQGAMDTSDVLTAFLTEMDGFKNDPSKPVFVMAATNYDVEPGTSRSLDGALVRRFDRHVYIDLPNKQGRIQYMQGKCANSKHYAVSEATIENLANRSVGMSLAILASVFEMALRAAIRQNSLPVTDAVLNEAFETFNNGEKKEWSKSTLERVARHEAGHAFLCWLAGETPAYVTAVSRGNHGGYMQYGDQEGKALYTRQELLGRIRTSLGGRAAELVYYGLEDGVSSGASGDLMSATRLAKTMICNYGMDAEMGLAVLDQNEIVGGMAEKVREATNRVLQEQMSLAISQIESNRKAIDALVEELLEKNHLGGSDIQRIFKENCE